MNLKKGIVQVTDISAVLERLELPKLPAKLPGEIIDSHTHADTTQEYSSLRPTDNLLAAAEVGVRRIVQIGCDVASSQWAVRLATTHPQVIAGVAVHPNDVVRKSRKQLDQDLAVIDSLAGSSRQVRAVGESGLDYFRLDVKNGKLADQIAQQKHAFRRHVEIAKVHDLTLAIHSRRAGSGLELPDALSDVADILDEMGWPKRTIFHCFSGDSQFASRAIAAGAYLSFAGNLTYPANRQLQAAMLATPADRLLVETDAPFLTPIPERGKKNAPYLIAHTVRFMAAHRGVELAQLCCELSANAFSAYGGSWGITCDQGEI